MRDYEQLFEELKAAMMEKLLENEHKAGFDSLTIFYAARRVNEETGELLECKTPEEAYWEFADIANFCAMGVLACKREMEK